MQAKMAKSQRIKRAQPEMDRIMKEYVDNADAPICELLLAANGELKQKGLADDCVFHSKYTVTHPKNRSGYILEPSNIAPLVSDIVDVGFLMSEVKSAASIRMPPPGDAYNAIEQKMPYWHKSRAGELRPWCQEWHRHR